MSEVLRKEAKMNERMEWVVEYAKKHGPVDILNTTFAEAYINKFHPKFMVQPYGAPSVVGLGRVLSKAYHCAMMQRSCMGLHAHERGFPNWVYVYEVPGAGQEECPWCREDGLMTSSGPDDGRICPHCHGTHTREGRAG